MWVSMFCTACRMKAGHHDCSCISMKRGRLYGSSMLVTCWRKIGYAFVNLGISRFLKRWKNSTCFTKPLTSRVSSCVCSLHTFTIKPFNDLTTIYKSHYTDVFVRQQIFAGSTCAWNGKSPRNDWLINAGGRGRLKMTQTSIDSWHTVTPMEFARTSGHALVNWVRFIG